jgi:hypothetical protein
MAVTDIYFQEREGQDFIVEIPQGTSHAPKDILMETNGSQYLIAELPAKAGAGDEGVIFIIND